MSHNYLQKVIPGLEELTPDEQWERLQQSTQEERRGHLRELGFTEEQIEEWSQEEGGIPWNILLLSNRALTPEEEAYAESLVPEILPDGKRKNRGEGSASPDPLLRQ